MLDRFRSGGFPEHESFSDDMFRATAQAMDSYNRAHERQQSIRRELEAERRVLREELQAGREELLREFKDGRRELVNEARENRRRVLDTLEEYYDRFL